MKLSHVDASGRPRMVDVSGKEVTARTAVAEGVIRVSSETFAVIEEETGPKGNVLATAELAGSMATKRTAELIPLCHTIPLTHADVSAVLEPDLPGVRVTATVRATARTGVEMEALTAVSVALLTVYDMVKALGHGMEIGEIRLLEKTGGAHGEWRGET
ncbi:MAG: cyclic pyranopterin monophosphate synthase MoaC [Gemmatimonadales bacterium]